MLNKPEDYKWTQEDILREYEKLHIEKSCLLYTSDAADEL